MILISNKLRFISGKILTIAVFMASFAGAQGDSVAGLRFAHLSPDAPLVDLIVNETVQEKDLSFSSVSSYLWLSPGRHELTVYPHRAPERGNGVDLLDMETAPNKDTAEPKIAPLEPFRIVVNLEAGRYYTVALSGFYNPPSAVSDLGSLSVNLEAGTRVRISGPRAYLTQFAESRLITGLEPGQYTVDAKRDGFKDLQYQVSVDAGQKASLDITFEKGETSPAPAQPNADDEVTEPVWQRAQLYLYEDNLEAFPKPGQVLVRLVHAAPGVSALEFRRSDIADNEAESARADTTDVAAAPERNVLASGVVFANATPYISSSAGQQALEIDLAASDFELISLAATLSPGALYTIYITSGLTDQVLIAIPTVDAVLRSPRKE